MVHDSLANMYQLNFALMQHHKYSLTELDNMIPFERDIYVALLQNFLKEQEEEQNKDNNNRTAKHRLGTRVVLPVPATP